MKMIRLAPLVAAIAFVAAPSTLAARDLAPDRIAVALGVTMAPDFEGSDDYVPTVGTGALARVWGRSITWKGNSLAVDLVPEYRDQNFKIVAGPLVDLNFDRALTPHDPVVALTRKRKTAIEGGGFVGFSQNGVLTSEYDSVSVTVTATYDLGNVHHSLVVSPSVSYTMPLSHAVMVNASLSADVVGGRYARYYFGVGPGSSALSGLPRYEPRGGVKSVSFGLGGGVALNGDLDRRGFLVGAVLNFERLVGSVADSPLVAIRGTPNQITGSVGVGYHF